MRKRRGWKAQRAAWAATGLNMDPPEYRKRVLRSPPAAEMTVEAAVEKPTDLEFEAKRAFVNMALGRLFRLAGRPEQPGDAEEFYRIRKVVLDMVPDLLAQRVDR